MRSCPPANEKLPLTSIWPAPLQGGGAYLSDNEWQYIIYVTFKWLLAGAYGLPHTCNALTQYSSYFNCLVYNVFLLFFFFSSQNFRRGGALAPCIDAPPLVATMSICVKSCNITLPCQSTHFFGFCCCLCRFHILQVGSRYTYTTVH